MTDPDEDSCFVFSSLAVRNISIKSFTNQTTRFATGSSGRAEKWPRMVIVCAHMSSVQGVTSTVSWKSGAKPYRRSRVVMTEGGGCGRWCGGPGRGSKGVIVGGGDTSAEVTVVVVVVVVIGVIVIHCFMSCTKRAETFLLAEIPFPTKSIVSHVSGQPFVVQALTLPSRYPGAFQLAIVVLDPLPKRSLVEPSIALPCLSSLTILRGFATLYLFVLLVLPREKLFPCLTWSLT